MRFLRFVVSGLLLAATLFPQSKSSTAQKAFDRATQAVKRQKFDEALADFNAAVAADPMFAEAWYELGKLQADRNQLPEAAKSLAAAIQADPNYPDPYRRLALVQQTAGDWRGLAQTSERLLKIDPAGRRLTYLFHAVAHFNLQDLDGAEKSAREAERLDAQHKSPIAWKILGEILLMRRNYAESTEQFKLYLQYVPNGPEAAATRARLAEIEKLTAAAKADRATPVFRAQTELALVRFPYTPNTGQLITDLRAEDIELREDGVPRKVVLFEGGRFHPRSLPLEITLLFDTSGTVSLARTLDPRAFDGPLLKEYENLTIGIYGFGVELRRMTAPTRYIPSLKTAMDAAGHALRSRTELFDSIAQTTREAAATGGNAVRIVVVVSDGQSSVLADLAKFPEAVRTAQSLGVAIFPVLVQGANAELDASTVSRTARGKPAASLVRKTGEASVRNYLDLAAATGGEAFTEIPTRDTLEKILASIVRRFLDDYVVGYDASSGPHKIEVVLRAAEKGRVGPAMRVSP